MSQPAEQNKTSEIDSTPPSPEKIQGKGELTDLIRDEIEKNNKYLEFAQGQISRDRDFYKHLFTYTGSFLTLILVVAGFHQYTSVTQMRADIKSSVDSELDRDKAEIAALQAQASAAEVEAQATVGKELSGVRTEVQKRIDTEFQTDNIAAMVNAAAKERTEKELASAIRSEAAAQVAEGIRTEQPFIRSTVENQTKEAVKELQPTIASAVNSATEQQVTKSVAPVVSQMSQYGAMIRMGTIATLARGDDRPAFDYLVQVSSGKTPESTNPDMKRLADTTVGAIIAEKQFGFHVGVSFKKAQTPQAIKQFMSSPNALEREAALDNYPQNDKSILPILVRMIETDGNVTVVSKAVGRFNELTGQSFDFWKESDILNWWGQNHTRFEDSATGGH